MNKIFTALVGAGIAWSAGAAFAAKTVEVARLKVTLNEEAWEAGDEIAYNGEVRSAMGTVLGKARVLTLRGAGGAPLAVMYVGGSYGKPNVYNRKGDCGSGTMTYVRDLGAGRPEDYRCLYFGGPVPSSLALEKLLPQLSSANQAQPVAAPESAYFLLLHVTTRGGVSVHVEALLAPEFAGLADVAPAASIPDGLPPATAAWADALAVSALKALTSFSGALPVPPVTFQSAPK